MKLLLIILSFAFSLIANPFAIHYEAKETLDHQDYIAIQNLLRSIDIDSFLEDLYPENQGYTSYEDFYSRCSRSTKQILIDEEKSLFPITKLIKIGRGSDCCFTCCVPYDGVRIALIESMIQSLQETGFNGYFLYLTGGFPNPTGREIQYVGVPYSFKIFMMLDAYYRGFNKVMWIDSACLPIRDPTPLFEWMDSTGSFLYGWHSFPWAWRYILPSTREILKNTTGVDVLNTPYVCTRVFGLKMNAERAKHLIREYYDLVLLGTPFLSCYPEEFVITAILGKSEYQAWKLYPFDVLRGAENGENDSQEMIDQKRAEGYFFYHLKH
ncbi:MAG TPA: hypothetical protein VLE96_00835 [Chlamydiales bacterium]|nr:hypothetical protein [Chlamydiales bacterium]